MHQLALAMGKSPALSSLSLHGIDSTSPPDSDISMDSCGLASAFFSKPISHHDFLNSLCSSYTALYSSNSLCSLCHRAFAHAVFAAWHACSVSLLCSYPRVTCHISTLMPFPQGRLSWSPSLAQMFLLEISEQHVPVFHNSCSFHDKYTHTFFV